MCDCADHIEGYATCRARGKDACPKCNGYFVPARERPLANISSQPLAASIRSPGLGHFRRILSPAAARHTPGGLLFSPLLPVGTYGFGGHFRNSTPRSVKIMPAAASSLIRTVSVASCGSRLPDSRSIRVAL
jgi:hypothetical protein